MPLVFPIPGIDCGSCGADLQVCAGPPGPALRATEPAISAHEEAAVDSRPQDWSPAPRITELAQNGKTSGSRQKRAWKLPEVLSLDTIQAESLDGAEIYSEHSETVPAPDHSWTIERDLPPEDFNT